MILFNVHFSFGSGDSDAGMIPTVLADLAGIH
jgi:hypothetical protein